MHSDPESCLPMETEVHTIALDSAPLDDFLLVPHNNLAEVRLPSDALPGTACITACITETVVCTVLTFDVFSCLRAIAVRQSQVHHINGLEPRGACSRGLQQIC